MSNYLTENLRTVALVGHSASGKTSLVEAMLVRTGAIAEAGSVERGNTVCDNDPQEKAVGHSLRMAVAHIDTAMPDLTPVRIHVIDTPGGPDYVGQALSALDAVKSVAVVVDATKGIELMTRRMMQWAEERGLCRVIVVNKIDAPDINLHELLDELKEAFGDGVLPINLPTKGCTRVIDCFDKDSGESDIMTVSDVHRAFIERVVEVDDETMEKYLEEGDVDPSTLHGPVTKALREAHVIPVCFTSAKNLIGIRDFMKVIIRHLPSPSEANDAQFIDKEGAPYQTQPDKTLPVVAHVFKVVSDPFVGKIGVFRVHQGCITAGSTLYVNDNKKPIKAARPLILQGKNTFETDELHPGDIGALNKIDELTYGCILHSDPNLDIRMRPLPFPKPMLGLAIAPARRGVPQIEVTFDIDANGILNVSAKDKGTGKEQKIRIEASSGLTEQEIQRMRDEAKANEAKDKEEKERIDKINAADSNIFATEKQLKEYGDKLPADKKAAIETALGKLKEAHKNADVAAIDTALAELNAAWQAASQDIYAAQQQQGGAQQGAPHADAGAGTNGQQQGGSNQPEDVEFEEVK